MLNTNDRLHLCLQIQIIVCIFVLRNHLLFNLIFIIMLSSKLIVALCDTDEEVNKFVHFNQREDLVRYMEHFTMGYKHVCGTPQKDGTYLMVDTELSGLVPDILFEHTQKVNGHVRVHRFYGYLMEEQKPQVIFQDYSAKK